MKKMLVGVLTLVIFVLGWAGSAQAVDLKWEQPPYDLTEPIGAMDTLSYRWDMTDIVVADDWECNDPRPITEITWWGSFPGWMDDTDQPVPPPPFAPTTFRLSWHEYTHPGDYSVPGPLIWEEYCTVFTEEYWNNSPNWYDPGTFEHEYMYHQRLEVPWDQTPGEFYFLDIEAVYEMDPIFPWGWKNTHPQFNWNDDAVQSHDGGSYWTDLTYPTGHPYEGVSMDMAFELYVDSTPSPTATPPPTATPSPSPIKTGTPLTTPTPSCCPPTATPPPTAIPPTATPTAPPPTAIPPTPTPTILPQKAVTGDYNGDGTTDVAVYRPSTGQWLIRNLTRVYYGSNIDDPVPQDYNGDGAWDIAVLDMWTNKWKIRGLTKAFYGNISADVPVPMDYDGDGSADIAVFRVTIGKWLVRGGASAYWGVTSDTTVPGDYNGDGTADFAVFRGTIGKWLVRNGTSAYYGVSTDYTLPGDYDGNGTDDFAVFRPSSGRWLVRGGSNAYWGVLSDFRVPGDYDGDGTLDFGVFRPSSGKWLIRTVTSLYYGASTDTPVSY